MISAKSYLNQSSLCLSSIGKKSSLCKNCHLQMKLLSYRFQWTKDKMTFLSQNHKNSQIASKDFFFSHTALQNKDWTYSQWFQSKSLLVNLVHMTVRPCWPHLNFLHVSHWSLTGTLQGRWYATPILQLKKTT